MGRDQVELGEALANARSALLEARGANGHWRGELSSSALSTATAVAALLMAARRGGAPRDPLLEAGLRGRAWLAANAGPDGGFGDTIDSPSNLSTTALAWMALGDGLTGGCQDTEADAVRVAHRRAAAWIEDALGGVPVTAPRLAAALEVIYGKDRTFAVPILTACAVGGAFGDDPAAWRSIRALPFELAVLPQGLFRFVGLPVVSYALPALIAIGQAIAHASPSRNPAARVARALARRRTLRVLDRIQPTGGGFLEATPLTSFVVLSLVSIGESEHAVVRRGLEFLRGSERSDGSWPIDTDLATWVTTLAVNALDGDLADVPSIREWLLEQQHTERHPYTGAAPGGWAWTDLPGGVPDADDTPGALLALRLLEGSGVSVEGRRAAHAGLTWLADLQNRDGGIPTFCRGWGTLPFDQSCADLTAHVLRAIRAWEDALDAPLARRLAGVRARAQRFLVDTQSPAGSWTPLWFGNQHDPKKQNPVYGTSRVLRAAAASAATSGQLDADWLRAIERGVRWLRSAQGEDGGFGGAPGLPASIEETALAVEGLADVFRAGFGEPGDVERVQRAASWLITATDGGRSFPRQPIGLYFAQLWYHEQLYPLVFTVSALAAASAMHRAP